MLNKLKNEISVGEYNVFERFFLTRTEMTEQTECSTLLCSPFAAKGKATRHRIQDSGIVQYKTSKVLTKI